MLKNLVRPIIRKLGFDIVRYYPNVLSDGAEGIIAGYEDILGRRPNEDELLYWRTRIESGLCHIDVFKETLHASYEGKVKRANQTRDLVQLERFRMYIDRSDMDVGAGIRQSKQYEPHVTSALLSVLTPGDTFLDIGANIGYFSLLAASVVGETGKVICFEPNVQNLRLLHASVLENGFQQVQVFPLAASDSRHVLKLQPFGSNGVLAAAPSKPSNYQFVQSVAVDDLVSAEGRVHVIKMDIEGYEALALRGMRQLIARHRPILFTEFNMWALRRHGGIEPEFFLNELINLGFLISAIGPLRTTDPSSDPASIMKLIRHDKDHLDLMAQPKE
ncbi:MAG: FkbM family methyltransferase [Candidatus Udaeobacter sp.]